jgi:AraC-like DNA-binding protein
MNYKFKFTGGGLHHCPPEWSWSFGPMTDYDVWMVLDGSGRMTLNEREYQLVSGSVFIFFPGTSGEAVHDPEDPLIVAACHFDCHGAAIPGEGYLYRELTQIEFIGELLRNAISAGVDRNCDDADFWLTAALKKILPEPGSVSFNRYASDIDKLCERIIRNPEAAYKVSAMAAEMCICKDHFTRLFKNLKGVSPQAYVVRARIERAGTLLSNSNLTISEIADQLNYSSVNFFIRQFKQETGITPVRFRKS